MTPVWFLIYAALNLPLVLTPPGSTWRYTGDTLLQFPTQAACVTAGQGLTPPPGFGKYCVSFQGLAFNPGPVTVINIP